MATKISVYSLSELKSTLDDHLPIFLTSPNLPPTSKPLAKPLRFTQSNFHVNVRLILGYTSVAVALYIFYLDYYLKIPFSEHKTATAYAVVSYFLLNGLLTLWMWKGERGVIFTGERKEGKGGVLFLTIRSFPPLRKYDPIFRMIAEWSTAGGKGGGGATAKGMLEVEVPFRQFFQADGTFVSGEFEDWLRKELPILRTADAEKAALLDAAEVPPAAAPGIAVPDEDLIVVETPTRGDSTGTPGTKKKAKRRA